MKEPRMLINFLIREIIVFDNEIHICFNSPLQTGPDASQGLSVCDRETTIPAHIQNSYELRRKNVRLMDSYYALGVTSVPMRKSRLVTAIRFSMCPYYSRS